MATRYKCPRCSQTITVHVRLSEPPVCSHKTESTGHKPSVMEEQK